MNPSRPKPYALKPHAPTHQLPTHYLPLPANSVTSLPESLGLCTALMTLDASHNRLAALPARTHTACALHARCMHTACALRVCKRALRMAQAGLGSLSALVEVHLSFNQLRSPLPAGLGGLKRLKVPHTRHTDARNELQPHVSRLQTVHPGCSPVHPGCKPKRPGCSPT